MNFIKYKIQTLENLINQDPENYNYYLLLSLEYAQQCNYDKAKYYLIQASLHCGKQYDEEMIRFMNYLYSSNRINIPDTSCYDLFFDLDGFELPSPTYTEEELAYIDELGKELQEEPEDAFLITSEKISNLPVTELRLVSSNDFYSL